jgi:SAM-dependent methyltransferase
MRTRLRVLLLNVDAFRRLYPCCIGVEQETIHKTFKGIRMSVRTQDEVNKRVYHARGVERSYKTWELTRAEAATLLKYQAAFAGRDVLDLGVGTGRTSVYLAPLARRYEGIDYSPVMVDHMRSNLPAISVRVGDLRDLEPFSDGSFDFVFGPNNVLDAVSHDDRLRSLAEVSRVLRPGGLFVFSSHHRMYRYALSGPRLRWSGNPARQAVQTLRWTVQVFNHLRFGRMRREEDDFALLNDEGHDYACLHYYIDQRHQRQQLTGAGFTVIDVLDRDGQSVREADDAVDSPWLMYVAKREAKRLAQ